MLLAEIPEDGLYTLSVFGESTGGQRWMADGCRKCVVCPSSNPLPHWRVVLSGRFAKGPHLFEASLGPDTVIERIRFEQKKDTPADYVGTVERLGLELGPEGPITREKAEEARRWLERRKTAGVRGVLRRHPRPRHPHHPAHRRRPAAAAGARAAAKAAAGRRRRRRRRR